jgi:hypothetical protein
VPLDGRGDEPLDVLRVGDVHDRVLRAGQARGLGDPLLVDVGRHDAGAFLHEADDNRAPDPVAGAGDDRDLPVEPSHGAFSRTGLDRFSGNVYAPARPRTETFPK